MSAVWSGHLHFGLVVIPVRLLVAARTKTTRFRRLYRKPILPVTSFPTPTSESLHSNPYVNTAEEVGTSKKKHIDERNSEGGTPYEYSPVRQVLQSVTGKEIRPDELVKGYEFAPNEFATIDPRAIKAAEVETSDTIELFHFVKAAEVDPLYFERSYYVAPDSGAEKVYGLLLEAIRREECFGIAHIGMHRREHMLILRPTQDCLVAHTMFYNDEVRPAPHLELDRNLFSEKELSIAAALIKAYRGEFEPKNFKDLYQERIRKIIDAEMSSLPYKTRAALPKPVTDVPDLMESIRLSLSQIEAKNVKSRPSKKAAQKALSIKKKPQRIRA